MSSNSPENCWTPAISGDLMFIGGREEAGKPGSHSPHTLNAYTWVYLELLSLREVCLWLFKEQNQLEKYFTLFYSLPLQYCSIYLYLGTTCLQKEFTVPALLANILVLPAFDTHAFLKHQLPHAVLWSQYSLWFNLIEKQWCTWAHAWVRVRTVSSPRFSMAKDFRCKSWYLFSIGGGVFCLSLLCMPLLQGCAIWHHELCSHPTLPRIPTALETHSQCTYRAQGTAVPPTSRTLISACFT